VDGYLWGAKLNKKVGLLYLVNINNRLFFH